MTTDKQPLVSVILPCYNSERYLAQTLASVHAQTYANWELIAVDDCSGDGTATMLREAAARDPRVRPFFRSERGGRPAVTKNTGLQHVRGDFIAFIDHDDLFLPDKLETSVSVLLEQADCIALFHDLEFIDASGTPSTRYLPRLLSDAQAHFSRLGPHLYCSDSRFWVFQLLRYAGFHTATTVIARHRLPQGSISFNTDYTICDDTDLWIRLGMAGRVAYVDRVMAQYRIHDGNLTSSKTRVYRDVAAMLDYNLRNRSQDLSEIERSQLKERLTDCYLDLAWSLRNSRERRAAMAACWQAFKLSPGLPTLVTLLKSFVPAEAA